MNLKSGNTDGRSAAARVSSVSSVSVSAPATPRIAVVDSIEHATLVIRSLRSFAHSQRSYHRAACSDNTILSGVTDLDVLVTRTSADIQQAQHVATLIATTPIVEPTSNTKDPCDKRNGQMDDEGDFSSDDDTTSSKNGLSKNNTLRHGKGDVLLSETSKKSSEKSRLVTKKKKPSRAKSGSDSDSSGFLDDDEDAEDVAALMQGFVAPKISHTSTAAASRSSSKTSSGFVKNKKRETSSSSAVRELEDEEGEHCAYLLRDHSGVETSKGGAGRGVDKLTRTSRSAGSDEIASTSRTRAQQSDLSQRQQSAPTPAAALVGSAPNNVAKLNVPKKHSVLITPGQRIRVQPSRKNK